MAKRPKHVEQEWNVRPARPVPLEDIELVEQVCSGETSAYARLVTKYQDRVFNSCWRICGNLEDARDLTQDAFLKALENIGSFRRQSSFYTWVFRVAVNLSLSHLRKTKRRRTVSLDDELGDRQTQADALSLRMKPTTVDDASDTAGDKEVHSRLLHALHELDDEFRAVVVLRDMEGLDYGEIGEILDVPRGTVKSRLHRARMALRASMTDSTDVEP